MPVQCDIDDVDIAEDISLWYVIENDEFYSRLKNYITMFDDENQRIFSMKFFQEYTFAQIADVMKLSESTVKSKYYRLLKKIKTEFLKKR